MNGYKREVSFTNLHQFGSIPSKLTRDDPKFSLNSFKHDSRNLESAHRFNTALLSKTMIAIPYKGPKNLRDTLSLNIGTAHPRYIFSNSNNLDVTLSQREAHFWITVLTGLNCSLSISHNKNKPYQLRVCLNNTLSGLTQFTDKILVRIDGYMYVLSVNNNTHVSSTHTYIYHALTLHIFKKRWMGVRQKERETNSFTASPTHSFIRFKCLLPNVHFGNCSFVAIFVTAFVAYNDIPLCRNSSHWINKKNS